MSFLYKLVDEKEKKMALDGVLSLVFIMLKLKEVLQTILNLH